jgi:hypothetical protein
MRTITLYVENGPFPVSSTNSSVRTNSALQWKRFATITTIAETFQMKRDVIKGFAIGRRKAIVSTTALLSAMADIFAFVLGRDYISYIIALLLTVCVIICFQWISNLSKQYKTL